MITSPSNPQIKNVTALLSKSRERASQDLFVVEGPKMLSEVPTERVERIYAAESFLRSPAAERCSGVLAASELIVVSDEVFARMSDTLSPQGVLCLVRQFHYREEELVRCEGNRKPLVMVLENLQDPGNLGTILRSGEGAGVTGVLLSRGCVDVYNPKVIRSTMGSVYRVPFVYTEDLAASLQALKEKGVRLFAAHLEGNADYDREDYTGAAGFMIGNESRGLSVETASLADSWVRIPMLGQVESLNAAMAAGILMYEAARQRRRAE